MAYEYKRLHAEIANRVARITIDNPPINLMNQELYVELLKLSAELEADANLSVVVLKSADPDFFIAHFDVGLILEFPVEGEAKREQELNPFHQMCERFRTMDKLVIAQIEGRAGGGGSELALSCDLRYGVRGSTIINQMEVPIGILPGGTGTQRLPRLVGRGRALEIILGGMDLDAETAERWGYLNRIFEADEIGPFVDQLAERVGSFPVQAVRLAKASVNQAERPLPEGLREEAYLFQRTLRSPHAREAMRTFLELGGQTREGERRVADLVREVTEALRSSEAPPTTGHHPGDVSGAG